MAPLESPESWAGNPLWKVATQPIFQPLVAVSRHFGHDGRRTFAHHQTPEIAGAGSFALAQFFSYKREVHVGDQSRRDLVLSPVGVELHVLPKEKSRKPVWPNARFPQPAKSSHPAARQNVRTIRGMPA